MKQETVSALSDELALKLPANTQILGVERQQGMDDMVRTKLRLTRTDFEQFRASVPVPEDVMEDDAGALLGPGPAWWKPPANARVGQAPVGNGRVLHLGIEDAGSGNVIVYLVNHGT